MNSLNQALMITYLPNKLVIAVFVMLVTFCPPLKSQIVFEKSYGTSGTDIAHCIELTADGGYLLAGQTGTSPDENIYLVKLDAYGIVDWSRIFSTTLSDQGFGVKQTTDGGYIVTGYMLDTAFVNRMFLLKTDASGNLEWSKIYSSSDKEEGLEVQQTADGGFVVAGYQYNEFYFGYDPLVMKTDASGNVEWCKVYPSHNAEWGDMHLEKTKKGEYYLTSIQTDGQTLPANENIYILKLDSNGNALSENIYGDSTSEERGFAVRELPSGNLMVAGSLNLKAMVFQIDTFGAVLWAKKYENGYDEMEVWSIDYKPEAGTAICGLENRLPSREDAFIFEIEDNGNAGWGKVYGKQYSYYWEEAYNIKIASDYGLAVAGASWINGQTTPDMYMIKTDNSGNTGCDSTTIITVTNVSMPVKQVTVQDSLIVMSVTDADFMVTEDCDQALQCLGATVVNSISNAPSYFFPNPANDKINYTGTPGLMLKEWKIFDQFGQLLIDRKTSANSIDVSALASGIYFIELSMVAQTSETTRSTLSIVH